MLRKCLFLPDVHIPFHDKRYFALVHSVCEKLKPEVIIIGGDFVDFYPISFFDKSPARRGSMAQELREARAELDKFDSYGAKLKIFCAGNHEHRLERYVASRCPELHELIPTIDQCLGFTEGAFETIEVNGKKEKKPVKLRKGWNYYPYKEIAHVGHCRIVHDVGVAGDRAHFKAAQSIQHTNATFHTHRAGIHYFGTIEGDSYVSAVMGWGGDKAAADYATDSQKKDWMLAFGWGYYNTDDETMHLGIIPSINYTCVVEGQLFKAPFLKSQPKKKHIENYAELLKRG